jgi:hypothetical protein
MADLDEKLEGERREIFNEGRKFQDLALRIRELAELITKPGVGSIRKSTLVTEISAVFNAYSSFVGKYCIDDEDVFAVTDLYHAALDYYSGSSGEFEEDYLWDWNPSEIPETEEPDFDYSDRTPEDIDYAALDAVAEELLEELDPGGSVPF